MLYTIPRIFANVITEKPSCRPAIVLLVVFQAFGATVDTTITADGTPGPYSLGQMFIDTASIRVAFADSTKVNVPPYTYVPRKNGILFAEPIDSGVVLRVRFLTTFYGLSKTYFLYKKTYLDTSDTAGPRVRDVAGGKGLGMGESSLNVSGFKSIGISFGNQGQLNLEQALDVRIFGMVGPETELSANLTDQETSLEGTTREIGELDMVYVALTNPRYNVTVGDQFVNLPEDGLVFERKKIKGISAGFTHPRFSVSAYGAVSGGKYAVQRDLAQQGFQGPYYLRGNGEVDIITPIGGTVKVFVDGAMAREGEDEDYFVDYDMGTVTFTPAFPISDNQVVRIEYEYKTFDYQRLFAGGDMGFASPDSQVVVSGAIWYETDNKNHEIDLPIDLDTARAALEESGDDAPNVPIGRAVDPTHVARDNQKYHLYKATEKDGKRVFYYAPYNKSTPADNDGYFIVQFRDVGEGNGDYRVVDSIQPDYRGAVYEYDSTGQGTFTASAPIPAPQRSVVGEVTAKINPKPWLSLETTIAGEDVDRNLFSDKDDDDNTAAASRTSLRVGEESYERRTAWLKARHMFSSHRFSRDVITYHTRRNRWNRENELDQQGQVNMWESWAGGTIVPGLSTELNYGQLIKKDTILTHRISNHTRLALGDRIVADYVGEGFTHADLPEARKTHRDKASITLDLDLLRWSLIGDDEWRVGQSDTGRGSIGGGTELFLQPINLTERFYYARRMRGTDLFFSPDTGAYLSWTQTIRHRPIKGWTLGGSSSHQRTHVKNARGGRDTVITTLINASSDVVSPRTGFSMNQNYSVTSERGSEFVQVVTYAGNGLGTHSFDSGTGEYQAETFGSFYAYEQEVYDASGQDRVRKTNLRGEWSFKPRVNVPKGLLSDIRWHGSFVIAEYTAGGPKTPASSWVPGYLSLRGESDSLVTYANMFYRQEARWKPYPLPSFELRLDVKPSHRKMRSIEEDGFEWGGEARNEWEKVRLILEGRRNKLTRLTTVSAQVKADIIQDRRLTLTEEFQPIRPLTLFVGETVGSANKETWGMYYVVKPGIRFMPMDRGFAEANYAFSFVDIDEALDYRMAQGYGTGSAHTISVLIDIRIGEHFNVGGTYRGEISDATRESGKKNGIHAFSLEMKAFL